MLGALWLLLRSAGRGPRWGFASGAASVLPPVFKQNIGMAFLGGVVGSAAGMLAFAVGLWATVGLGNFLRWTVSFAAERRMPGLGEIGSTYAQGELVWMLPVLAAGILLSCRVWAGVVGQRWRPAA